MKSPWPDTLVLMVCLGSGGQKRLQNCRSAGAIEPDIQIWWRLRDHSKDYNIVYSNSSKLLNHQFSMSTNNLHLQLRHHNRPWQPWRPSPRTIVMPTLMCVEPPTQAEKSPLLSKLLHWEHLSTHWGVLGFKTIEYSALFLLEQKRRDMFNLLVLIIGLSAYVSMYVANTYVFIYFAYDII